MLLKGIQYFMFKRGRLGSSRSWRLGLRAAWSWATQLWRQRMDEVAVSTVRAGLATKADASKEVGLAVEVDITAKASSVIGVWLSW